MSDVAVESSITLTPQNCSTTAGTITNLSPWRKNLLLQARCDKPSLSISPLKTLRNNTNPTLASMSNYGGFTPHTISYLALQDATGPGMKGLWLTVRYFIRVTLARRIGEVVKEKEIWVHSYRMPPDSNTSIKMEVGIEDCLHIEFEYNKAK